LISNDVSFFIFHLFKFYFLAVTAAACQPAGWFAINHSYVYQNLLCSFHLSFFNVQSETEKGILKVGSPDGYRDCGAGLSYPQPFPKERGLDLGLLSLFLTSI